jgi:hypothetical protein
MARVSSHADSLHQDADYPAIVPAERSKAVLGRELTSEENSIRGMLVSGLTAEDVVLLDEFEGNARIYLFPLIVLTCLLCRGRNTSACRCSCTL